MPLTSTIDQTQAQVLAIPSGPAVVTSSLTVSGATTPICDLDITAFLAHASAADLDVTLTSPAGTVVTITTDNGGANDDVFAGTLWNDDANPVGQVPYASNDGLVTDSVYADGVLETPLVVEEALAAFNGEFPNGEWLLTISDDLAGNSGQLVGWTLHITTCQCPQQVNAYLDHASFAAAVANAGSVLKASWDFKPHDVPPASSVVLNDPLDRFTHASDPDDPWTTAGGGNLWPPFVDSVTFLSNVGPPDPFVLPVPRQVDGLSFGTTGSLGYDNNVLMANVTADGFVVWSGPPTGDAHNAVGLELVDALGSGQLQVTVFRTDDGAQMARYYVNVAPGAKAFLGLVSMDGSPIGWIDLRDAGGSGHEGVSSIELWHIPVICPWDCSGVKGGDGNVDVVDFLGLLADWGEFGPCDIDGGGVSVTDLLLLLAHWGPCPE